MLKDEFGFVEGQGKSIYGLGFILNIARNKDEAVVDEVRGTDDARIKNDHIHWYVPHFTSSIQQQGFLSKQFLSKTPTDLRYIERLFS